MPPAGRVAVLGATGSLGRQVCRCFTEAGRLLLGVARHPGHHVAVDGFRSLDLSRVTPDELAEVLDDFGVDVVVNAAGEFGDTEDELRRMHPDLVENVIAALQRARTRIRLVHLGSVHEYGPVVPGTAIAETHRTDPSSPYARMKLLASRRVLEAVATADLDAVVLRVVNTVGPYPNSVSFAAALLDRLHAALRRSAVLELDLADARRDFVDVRDVARAVVLAAAAPDLRGVVNIGSGRAVPVRDVVDGLVDAATFPRDRLTVRYRDVVSKGGDWTQMDIRFAARRLGWRPRIGLPESLSAMWEASASAAGGPPTTVPGTGRLRHRVG